MCVDMNRLTLDIVCEASFGICVDAQNDQSQSPLVASIHCKALLLATPARSVSLPLHASIHLFSVDMLGHALGLNIPGIKYMPYYWGKYIRERDHVGVTVDKLIQESYDAMMKKRELTAAKGHAEGHREEESKEHKSLLELLLVSGDLTVQEIREELLGFVLAGAFVV